MTKESTEPSKLLQPGTIAPVYTLKGIDGGEYTFPQAGSWNMVVYWSLFCHSCLEEIPEVQLRLNALNDAALRCFFVSLDTERMQKALINYSKKRDLKLPILMEQVASDSYLTADQWGVVSTPVVFIVAPDGKVAYSHQGPMDLDQFFAGFSAMKASQPVELPPER
jgi:peroxiredoxin